MILLPLPTLPARSEHPRLRSRLALLLPTLPVTVTVRSEHPRPRSLLALLLDLTTVNEKEQSVLFAQFQGNRFIRSLY